MVSEEVGLQMMVELYEGVLGEFGFSVEQVIGTVASTFNGKGDIMNCNCWRAMKLLSIGCGMGV